MTTERRIGDWIDNRYQVYDIHTGGMGLVYVVYDHEGESGERVLALKTLRDEFLRDSRRISRFVTECRTWVRLDRHPNIVRAHSVQIIDGRPFIVLELVTGGSLRRWIGSPRLDLPTILRFGIQYCLAMEHALRKGLHCHRDIKPENLLITEGGTLKVTDFGLAKVQDEATLIDDLSEPIPLDDSTDESVMQIIHDGSWPAAQSPTEDWEDTPSFPNPSTESSDAWDEWVIELEQEENEGVTTNRLETVDWVPERAPRRPGEGGVLGSTIDHGSNEEGLSTGHTQSGAQLGTGTYMAPEQFRDAKTVNSLADLYSFGIVLYEMITRRPPFRGRTLSELRRQHTHEDPPSLYPYIPGRYSKWAKGIDRVVRRCLEKDPKRRFATFVELRLALSQILYRMTGEKMTAPSESDLDAWELNGKGVSLGTLGLFEEERQAYETSFQSKPDYVPTWFNQAAALGSLGRLEEAIEYAEMALHLNASSVPALINKGLILYALGHPDESIYCFDAAIHLRPHDPDIWYGRGVVLQGLGNLEGARVALNQAQRLRPAIGMPQLGIDVPDAGQSDQLLKRTDASTWTRNLPWVRRVEDTHAPSHRSNGR